MKTTVTCEKVAKRRRELRALEQNYVFLYVQLVISHSNEEYRKMNWVETETLPMTQKLQQTDMRKYTYRSMSFMMVVRGIYCIIFIINV